MLHSLAGPDWSFHCWHCWFFSHLAQLSLAWQREAEWRKQRKIAERKMQQKEDGSMWGLEREAALRRGKHSEGQSCGGQTMEAQWRRRSSGGGQIGLIIFWIMNINCCFVSNVFWTTATMKSKSNLLLLHQRFERRFTWDPCIKNYGLC